MTFQRLCRFPRAPSATGNIREMRTTFPVLVEGVTYVMDTADSFRVIATNSLDEVAMSSPAISRGSLFIRTRSYLWRLSDASR